MGARVLVGAGLAVMVVGGSIAGVWWQRERAAAQIRDRLISAASVELQRDPLDRGGLVQADRDLANLASTDPDPGLRRSRARIALLLRMPEDALRLLDEVMFRGQASTADLDLRARALADRHALGGRADDAHQAIARAIEHFDATQSVESVFLAWQCATRLGDVEASEKIAGRLAVASPDCWQTKVVAALMAFDPEKPATGAGLRQLQLDVQLVPELDTAIAMLDVVDPDPAMRSRGVETIRRVLTDVPASKPARLVAVLAHDRIGDVAGRRAHLMWLVTNFPRDERADTWRRMSTER